MAFYTPPNPTGDPNYLRQSKEPDRIAPLQQVAIPANRVSDTSYGELFKGIADVAGAAISGADGVIKRSIKDDAFAAIDPIRSAAGGDLSPDEAAQIAGTGAKGRARAYEMGNGGALFGPASAEAGGGEVIAPDAKRILPPDAEQELERVKRMNEAKAAGKLSDSYYNAQLVATTKELRARYPGYREEVDHAVSEITGIVPANALRRSLLADMNANAIAKLSSASDQVKWEEKNAGDIMLDRPDYFVAKAKYSGQLEQIKSDVYTRQGRTAYIKSQEAEIGFDATKAQATATQKADLIASTGIAALTNTIGLGDAQTLASKMLAFRNGAKPEELAAFNTSLETLRAQKEIAIRKSFTEPIEGRADGASYNMIIKDPAKVDAIVNQSLAQYTALQTAIKNKAFDQAATIANQVTMSKNVAAKEVMDKVPSIKILAGLSVAGGDAAVGVILQGSQLLPNIQKSLNDTKLIETMGATDPAKPPPGINSQAEEIKKASGGQLTGQQLKALVDGNLKIIHAKELPPDVSAAGVRNLFDQKFFANLTQSERMQAWTMIGSPVTSARVIELGKNDPALVQQYESWQKYAFQATFGADIGNASDAMTDPRFTVKFNPETHQIDMIPKAGLNQSQRGGPTLRGEAMVSKVNQGLALMVPVLEAQKKDVNAEIMQTIQGMGINLNSKTDPGNPLLHNIGRTIRDMFMGPPDDRAQPAAPKPGKGRLSLNEAEEPVLRTAIAQGESGGDYNAVFGMGKSSSRDLSQNSVGEIMAMQKHYTDSGSASSAVGKYQFLRKTLDSLVKEGAVDIHDQFTPEVQDKLAVALMKRRGLDDFRAGKITKEEFNDRLASEWASLKKTDGRGAYDGDGLNKGLTSVMALL